MWYSYCTKPYRYHCNLCFIFLQLWNKKKHIKCLYCSLEFRCASDDSNINIMLLTWLLFVWGQLNMCVRVFFYNLNFLWGFRIVGYIQCIHHQDCCQQRSNLDVCRDDSAYIDNILSVYFEWILLGMIEFWINIIGIPFRFL